MPNSLALTTDAPEVELFSVRFRVPPDSDTLDAYMGVPLRAVPLSHAYHLDVSMLVPLNSSDQTILQLPAGPLGCTDAGGVTCVDVGLGAGPDELPPADDGLGAGELLLPGDGDVDELGDGLQLQWWWRPWPAKCRDDHATVLAPSCPAAWVTTRVRPASKPNRAANTVTRRPVRDATGSL